MTVSLVGYTNAGKSTLMNALTGADVFVEDELFATLDTRTRRWQLPGWGPVLLSDTVGFIRDLPHHLIASFKATLEEARQADLLLHVADASQPGRRTTRSRPPTKCWKRSASRQKDTLLVLNKIDALPDRVRVDGLLEPLSPRDADQRPHGPGLAATGRGGQRGPEPQLPATWTWRWAWTTAALLAYLAAHGEVLSKQYRDTRVVRPLPHLGPDSWARFTSPAWWCGRGIGDCGLGIGKKPAGCVGGDGCVPPNAVNSRAVLAAAKELVFQDFEPPVRLWFLHKLS